MSAYNDQYTSQSIPCSKHWHKLTPPSVRISCIGWYSAALFIDVIDVINLHSTPMSGFSESNITDMIHISRAETWYRNGMQTAGRGNEIFCVGLTGKTVCDFHDRTIAWCSVWLRLVLSYTVYRKTWSDKSAKQEDKYRYYFTNQHIHGHSVETLPSQWSIRFKTSR